MIRFFVFRYTFNSIKDYPGTEGFGMPVLESTFNSIKDYLENERKNKENY